MPAGQARARCAPCAAAPGLSAADAERVAGILKALADPVRLRLFSSIAACGDEICVCEIPDVGVSQPTVSHHLRKLREAGLIDSQRRGTWVYCRATDLGSSLLRSVDALT